jgi:hypothetical protein
MWVGIVANLAMALPALFRPAQMLEMMGLPGASAPVWLAFSALLLILLSAFYVPAAVDPYRYRANAWLAVGGRLAGTVFFFLQGRQYWLLGAFDLVFFVPLAALLVVLVSSSPPALPSRQS